MEKLKKVWPFLVSLSGAMVMILAFFIPSIQDQWDRYQARLVIEKYEKLGDDFFEEEHFEMAEEAYAKAFELSEQKRLDIEVRRLDAKVNRVNENPFWGGKLPEGLKEIDFQYLLHFQKDKRGEKTRVLNSYGVFLSSLGKLKEAENAFNEALHLDSKNELVHVNLGSLFRHQGKLAESRKEYVTAISLDPENPRTHYNLGLLYLDQLLFEEAKKEFVKAVELDPEDADAKTELASVNEKLQDKKP